MTPKPTTLAHEIREASAALFMLIFEITCIGAFLAGIAFVAARLGV